MEYFQICFQFALVYLDSGCEVLVKRMQILNFVSTKSSWKTNLTHSCIYFILKQDSQKFLLILVLMVIKMTICGNDLSGHLVGSQSLENQPKTCCCTKDATQCTVRPL